MQSVIVAVAGDIKIDNIEQDITGFNHIVSHAFTGISSPRCK